MTKEEIQALVDRWVDARPTLFDRTGYQQGGILDLPAPVVRYLVDTQQITNQELLLLAEWRKRQTREQESQA